MNMSPSDEELIELSDPKVKPSQDWNWVWILLAFFLFGLLIWGSPPELGMESVVPSPYF